MFFYNESDSEASTIVTSTIVTDGLQLHLDAGDTNSYSGTGTTWFDLSGNGNDGVLTNGPFYDSGNLGSFVLDGNDDDIRIASNDLARIGTGNHTIMAWVNNDIVTEEDIVGTNGTNNGNVLLMIYGSAGGGSGGFRGHAWGSTGDSNVIDSPISIGTGNWNLLCQRVEWGGNIELFENGVKTATKALVGSASTSSSTMFIVGSRDTSSGSHHFDGKIAIVMVYNRALTDAEILQNFEVTKSRFGL